MAIEVTKWHVTKFGLELSAATKGVKQSHALSVKWHLKVKFVKSYSFGLFCSSEAR